MFWLPRRNAKLNELQAPPRLNLIDVQLLPKSESCILTGIDDPYDAAVLVAIATPNQVCFRFPQMI